MAAPQGKTYLHSAPHFGSSPGNKGIMKKLVILALGFVLSVFHSSWAAYTVPSQPNSTARVHLFYYPWYGNPASDGGWIHWNQGGHNPPDDIGANFYPLLGAYSSANTTTIDTHMSWMQRAHAKAISYSWWGRGGREDQLTRRTMDSADRYGIKVCFHIEPYGGRTAASVRNDIIYIYDTYGNHPAFLTVSRPTRWGNNAAPRAVFSPRERCL